ncbi:MAG: hypothetical protein GY752_02560 [bacterium]|nr:hypothetical protein [bacterium]MCP4799383.1 hypothetical protein [bacterium]
MRKRLAVFYLVLLVLIIGSLIGCRAFNPEVVIVNRPPETFIIGAPNEEAGGYFHYHLFWYGSDDDGHVERFVWALTDSTVQDDETDEDEEDARFNPALHINTLDIGHWTTRTDTIFDFQIGLGSLTSVDKTFHIVAVDDRGDYDRTPARLYFLINALGSPSITFLTEEYGIETELQAGEVDTFSYGKPYALSWTGETPNIRSFTDELLAERDTVFSIDPDTGEPVYDGLLGFKYKISLADCDDAIEDCWNPRQFDDAVNDSVSFFGGVTRVDFTNDGSGAGLFNRVIASGTHTLLVNSIDVAGVEVSAIDRRQYFVVNYDPDTHLVLESDPAALQDPFGNDGLTYPYYTVWTAEATGLVESDPVSFSSGERLPHRAKVVFKILGWDDARDLRLLDNPDNQVDSGVTFQSKIEGVAFFTGTTSSYRFRTQYNDLTWTPDWNDYNTVSADTISFLTGPAEFEFRARSVDEHTRRDNSFSNIEFSANFEPSITFIETVVNSESSYQIGDEIPSEPDTLWCSFFNAPSPLPGEDWKHLNFVTTPQTCWVNPVSGSTTFQEPNNLDGLLVIPGNFYEYELYFTGDDNQLEKRFSADRAPHQVNNNPIDRAPSWRFEVRSEHDPDNVLNDGGLIDNITAVTTEAENWTHVDDNPRVPIVIDEDGVWRARIDVFVPNILAATSPYYFAGYYLPTLTDNHGNYLVPAPWIADSDASDWSYDQGLRQMTIYAPEREQFLNRQLPLAVQAGTGSGDDYEQMYIWDFESVVDNGDSVVLTSAVDLEIGPEGLDGMTLQLRDDTFAWSVVPLTTPQLGLNTVSAVMRDATTMDANPNRCRYVYYTALRVPEFHGDSGSEPYPGFAEKLKLHQFCLESELVEKQFYMCFVGNDFIYPPRP